MGAKSVRETARLLKVSAAKLSEVPRMSAIPSPKHPAVDITSPPENPELAIAIHFAETVTERSTAELLWALPHLKGAMPRSGQQYGLVAGEIARRQKAKARHSPRGTKTPIKR